MSFEYLGGGSEAANSLEANDGWFAEIGNLPRLLAGRSLQDSYPGEVL